MLNRDWKETWHNFLEIMVVFGGYVGQLMVWLGLTASCIILWYFVFILIGR
jgi:hypothetical protein